MNDLDQIDVLRLQGNSSPPLPSLWATGHGAFRLGVVIHFLEQVENHFVADCGDTDSFSGACQG